MSIRRVRDLLEWRGGYRVAPAKRKRWVEGQVGANVRPANVLFRVEPSVAAEHVRSIEGDDVVVAFRATVWGPRVLAWEGDAAQADGVAQGDLEALLRGVDRKPYERKLREAYGDPRRIKGWVGAGQYFGEPRVEALKVLWRPARREEEQQRYAEGEKRSVYASGDIEVRGILRDVGGARGERADRVDREVFHGRMFGHGTKWEV